MTDSCEIVQPSVRLHGPLASNMPPWLYIYKLYTSPGAESRRASVPLYLSFLFFIALRIFLRSSSARFSSQDMRSFSPFFFCWDSA